MGYRNKLGISDFARFDTLALVIYEQQEFTNSIENIIKAENLKIQDWEPFEDEFCGIVFIQYKVVDKDDEDNWKWSWE